MPDEVYVWRPENPEPANDLRIRDEPPELVVATRYTRADRIDPAIIAAIDGTIARIRPYADCANFDDRIVDLQLSVGQLREIRRALGD